MRQVEPSLIWDGHHVKSGPSFPVLGDPLPHEVMGHSWVEGFHSESPGDWTSVQRQEAGTAEPQLGNSPDVSVGDPRERGRSSGPQFPQEAALGRPFLQFPSSAPISFHVGVEGQVRG